MTDDALCLVSSWEHWCGECRHGNTGALPMPPVLKALTAHRMAFLLGAIQCYVRASFAEGMGYFWIASHYYYSYYVKSTCVGCVAEVMVGV